jgi:hypothetical protein
MKIAVKNILPNPFRRLDHFPIDREKVEVLKESINETGWWSNILARPTKDGKVEIAYGHHRLVAVKEIYKPNDEIGIITNPLTDADMVRIMARENHEAWGAAASVTKETVRVIVEGYAEGRWELPKPVGQKVRYAPRFTFGTGPRSDSGKPYTEQTLAAFSGLKVGTVSWALEILAAEEEGLVTPAQTKRIEKPDDRTPAVSTRGVSEAVRQIRRAVKKAGPRADRKKVVSKAVQAIAEVRKKGGGRAQFKSAVDKVVRTGSKADLNYNRLALSYARRLAGIEGQTGKLFKDLKEIAAHRDEVHAKYQREILILLRRIGNQALAVADLLEHGRKSTGMHDEMPLLTAGRK